VSAGGNHVDAVGLFLGIAVEGVLNTEFTEIVKVPQDQKDWIDTVLTTVRGIATLPERLCARIQGALGAMKSPRAKDKLRALIETHVIEQKHVDAWDALRNSSAHAVHFDAKDIQDHLARCYMVYELLLLLIYHAIQFKGPYRSFGTSGWSLVPQSGIRAEDRVKAP
jgi:hypothetical protein